MAGKSNNFFADLGERLTPKVHEGLFTDWVLENKLLTTKGEPFEFVQHKFLVDILNDWTPQQAIPKGAQVGVTEGLAVKTIYAAAFKQWNVIYTLPSDDDIKGFVPTKLNVLINRNKALKDLVDTGESMYRKKVRQNFVFYRGTMTDREAISVTSDLNVYDELDRSNQHTVQTYKSRLGFSKYKGEWSLSNLSAPLCGVDYLYQMKSDKRHWHIRCPKCDHDQFMSWPDSIKFEVQQDRVTEAFYACKKCGAEIPDEIRADGIWVPHADGDVSGYWINHLMCSWISAKEIVEASLSREPGAQAYFHNFVIGLPYSGSDENVDKEVVLRSMIDMDESDYTHLPSAMGIDTGLIWHVIVGNEKGIFLQKACDEEEAKAIYDKYKPVTVIDLKGDTTMTRRFMNENKGRVFGCDYKRDKEDREIVRWGVKEKWGIVYVDRNRMIDAVIADFRQGRLHFINQSQERLENYIKHWSAIYKMREKDSLGIEREKWELTGRQDDHFVHATVYFKTALSKIATSPFTVRHEVARDHRSLPERMSLDYVLSRADQGEVHWTKL